MSIEGGGRRARVRLSAHIDVKLLPREPLPDRIGDTSIEAWRRVEKYLISSTHRRTKSERALSQCGGTKGTRDGRNDAKEQREKGRNRKHTHRKRAKGRLAAS